MRLLLVISFFFSFYLSQAQNIFDINNIKEIRLTFKETDWDKKLDSLKKQGNEFRLWGSMRLDGITYDSVAVRYKGNSSYNAVRLLDSPKLPFNIKTNEAKKKQFLPSGYETLKLSNIFRDPSFLREALSYEMLRKYMPASHASFIRLYVNEKLIGFYNSVEPVEEAFLTKHFGSDKGVLVKCDPDWHSEVLPKCPESDKASLTYLGEDPLCYMTYYEMKSHDKIGKLVEFIKTLNKEPQKIESILNVDQVLWMHAFNNTLVNLDSYLGKLSHNYYVYRDTFGVWQPIVWDLNLCFGGFRLDGIEPTPLSNEKLQSLSPMAHATDAQFPLLSQLLKNDLYKKLYIAHIRTILNENFVSNAFYTRAKEVQNQIDFYVKEDKNKLYSYESFKQNMDVSADAGKSKIIGITELMQKRTEVLKAHPLLTKAAPKINDYRQTYNGDKVQITCRLENAQKAVLYYRTKKNAPFKTMDFKDDGYQGDGAALDGHLGLQLLRKDCVQYYIMAINADAASVLPERASYEFFEVKQ